MIQRVVVGAPAKINLLLDITGIAENGYHTLRTVMHAVALQDLIVLSKRRDGELRIACPFPGMPEDETNIVHKAMRVFLEAAGLANEGVTAFIDKAIPHEAGLGGGSADAAAVLHGLNRLFAAGLSARELREIGLKIGADVPFCVIGGCALAEGVGERLTALPALPDCRIVIAKPAGGVSTREAYAAYDGHRGRIDKPDADGMLAAIRTGDLEAMGKRMQNVFEDVLQSEQTGRIKHVMLQNSARGAGLSGSGSAVAGIFASEAEALDCMQALRAEQGVSRFLTRPLAEGPAIIFAG